MQCLSGTARWESSFHGPQRSPLDHRGDALAAANAQGGEAGLGVAFDHLVQQRHKDARARGADGVAQGDGAAVDVHLAHVKAQFPGHGNALRGKGLVGLDQVHVGDGLAGLGQRLGRGRGRADAHDLRVHAGRGVAGQPGHGGDAEFLRLVRGHDDDDRRAVVDARGVGRGHLAVLAEGGPQPGDLLHGGARGVVFVRVEQLRVALALRDRHGHDLVLEAAGRDGGLGLLLGGGGELVADVLRGQTHVDVVHGAVQAVVDHHVDHAGGRHVHAVAEAGLRQGVGGGTHVLHAAGDDDVRVAAADG